MNKKERGGVAYARKGPYEYDNVKYEADLKNGDIVTILDSGIIETGNYKGKAVDSWYFKVRTRNGEKKAKFNQKSINILIDEFGEDSDNWVGKDVLTIVHKTLIAGEKQDVVYFVTEGWKLDEYGELVKEGGVFGKEDGPDQEKTGAVDTVEYPEEIINPEDIPF